MFIIFAYYVWTLPWIFDNACFLNLSIANRTHTGEINHARHLNWISSPTNYLLCFFPLSYSWVTGLNVFCPDTSTSLCVDKVRNFMPWIISAKHFLLCLKYAKVLLFPDSVIVCGVVGCLPVCLFFFSDNYFIFVKDRHT